MKEIKITDSTKTYIYWPHFCPCAISLSYAHPNADTHITLLHHHNWSAVSDTITIVDAYLTSIVVTAATSITLNGALHATTID